LLSHSFSEVQMKNQTYEPGIGCNELHPRQGYQWLGFQVDIENFPS